MLSGVRTVTDRSINHPLPEGAYDDRPNGRPVTQRSFVERRQAGWTQLESIVAIAERRGLRSLEAEQVAELGRLYRWVTSDLAYAHGHRFDPALRAYLNRLTARAHGY